jgi:O-antigen/teichoic acid export membrane protein
MKLIIDNFRKIFKVTSERLIFMVLGILLNLILAKYFSPELFSDFLIPIIFFSMFLGLTNLGIDKLILQIGEKLNHNQRNNLIVNTLILRLFFSLIVFFITTIYIFFYRTELIIFSVIITTSLCFKAFDSIDLRYNLENIFGKFAKLRSSIFIIFFFFKFYVIVNYSNLIILSVVYFFESLLISFYLIYHSVKFFKIFSQYKIKFQEILNLFKQGISLIISLFLEIFSQRIFLLLAIFIIPSEKYSSFYLAFLVCEVCFQIFYISSTVFIPDLNAMFSKIGDYNKKIKKLTLNYLIFSIIVFFIIKIIGFKLIIQIIGPNYDMSIHYFNIIGISIIFNSLSLFRAQYLINISKINIIVYINIISLTILLISYIFLSSYLDAYSLSYALLIYSFFVYFGQNFFFKPLRHFNKIIWK